MRVFLASLVLVGVSTAVVGTNDQERVIWIYNIHNKETLKIAYKRNGKFIPSALKKVNHIMRDWRRNVSRQMDPKLIDLVWELHNQLGSQKPVHLISGYRSKTTNERLRRKGGGQARNSRHIMGKAADIHFPDVSVKQIRNSALIRERGGVGYYPTSAIPFVHVDTSGVRHWPRLPRLELASLFPSGKTKHRPRRGGPITKRDHVKAMARLSKKEKHLLRIARGEIRPDVKAAAPVQVARAETPIPSIAPSPVATQRAIAASDVQGLNQLAAAVAAAPTQPANAGVAAPKPTQPQKKTVSPQTPLWQTASASAVPSFSAPKPRVAQPQQPARQVVAALTPATKSKIADRWRNVAEPAVSKPQSSAVRAVAAAHTPVSTPQAQQPQPASFATASADPLGALIERAAFQKPAPQVAKLARYEPPRDLSLDVGGGSDGASDGWARAPEFDDEHDDALAYMPFSILPLMNENLASEHNPLSKLVHPEYSNILALAEPKAAFPLHFRQNASWAQQQWRERFENDAVAGFGSEQRASLNTQSLRTASASR